MKFMSVTTLLTAASLLAPALSAQRPPASADTSATRAIVAVSEQELERQITVADLLGKSVVDENDETIGALRDIDLSAVFAHAGATESSSASGAAQVRLLITAGATQLVSVDARQVSYDQTRDHLALNASLSDPDLIEDSNRAATAGSTQPTVHDDELAPVEVAVNDPANTIEPVAVAAVPGSDLVVATTGTEVLQVEEALASNAQTSEVADQINVLSANDAILLTGSLESEDQREQVLQVAREASHREVRDLLQVAAE
jgi:hypothetical protein